MFNNGGEILSGDFFSNKSKIFLCCKHGHKWETSVLNLFNDSWCYICRCGTSINYRGKYYDTIKSFCKENNIKYCKLFDLMSVEKDWSIKKAADFLIYNIGERKSKTFVCELCGEIAEFPTSTSGPQKYCLECRQKADHLRYKKRAVNQKKERQKKKQKAGWYCKKCGKEIKNIHGNRKYCLDCDC